MSNEAQALDQDQDQHQHQDQDQDQHQQDIRAEEQQAAQALNDVDGLGDKKPEELTQEELRLMADTMPGEGPGD
jgi:hypothetical protein